MNASKKARTALRAKKRSAAEQHDSPDEPMWLAPTAGGASAGIVAQHSGIMPVAVVLFTALSFVSFWRAAPIVSEAAKSLVDIHYDEAKLAGMLPPPDASRREGNTSYWPEAKVWTKKVRSGSLRPLARMPFVSPKPTAHGNKRTNANVGDGMTRGEK